MFHSANFHILSCRIFSRPYIGKSPAVGLNSPLTVGQIVGDWQGNIQYTLNDSLALGVPADKLVVAVPVYGRQHPTFDTSDSLLDRQLWSLGKGVKGVNGSMPSISTLTIGYPLSLVEHEAAMQRLCFTASADLMKNCSPGGPAVGYSKPDTVVRFP